jgi:hypothetical protein
MKLERRIRLLKDSIYGCYWKAGYCGQKTTFDRNIWMEIKELENSLGSCLDKTDAILEEINERNLNEK